MVSRVVSSTTEHFLERLAGMLPVKCMEREARMDYMLAVFTYYMCRLQSKHVLVYETCYIKRPVLQG